VDDPIAVLRRDLRFRSTADALPVARALWKQRLPGSAAVILLDDAQRLVDLLCVVDGGDHLPDIVAMLCGAQIPNVTGLLLLSDRTGEVPADRSDDELTWMEIAALAAEHDVTVYDWLVLSDRWAFSVAEFAPVPAQW
jgi:hypothetical protein